jgi:hypothetical protein
LLVRIDAVAIKVCQVQGLARYPVCEGAIARALVAQQQVLWFGTWKGDEAQYLPDWIASDRKRFPTALDAGGKASNSLSPHGAATLEADRKAFGALMKHLREIDENDRTVILVQVENEPEIVGPARDHSPEANKLFKGPVPEEFVAALKRETRNLDAVLRPPVRRRGVHDLLHG